MIEQMELSETQKQIIKEMQQGNALVWEGYEIYVDSEKPITVILMDFEHLNDSRLIDWARSLGDNGGVYELTEEGKTIPL